MQESASEGRTVRHPTWMRVVAVVCLLAALALVFVSIP